MQHKDDFIGAKVAVFVGEDLLVKLRDDFDTIPWPNHWDFPGGGRDSGETPIETAIRETREEFSITLHIDDFVWARIYPAKLFPGSWNWFFVARINIDMVQQVALGDEGQEWRLMSVDDYCDHDLRIPHFADQLKDYMDDQRKSRLPYTR